jgi:hypothetical protein
MRLNRWRGCFLSLLVLAVAACGSSTNAGPGSGGAGGQAVGGAGGQAIGGSGGSATGGSAPGGATGAAGRGGTTGRGGGVTGTSGAGGGQATDAGQDAGNEPTCAALGLNTQDATCGPRTSSACAQGIFECYCSCYCTECQVQSNVGTYQDPNCTCPPGHCQTVCDLSGGALTFPNAAVHVDCSSGQGVVTVSGEVVYSDHTDNPVRPLSYDPAALTAQLTAIQVTWSFSTPACTFDSVTSLSPAPPGATPAMFTATPGKCDTSTTPVNICAACGGLASVRLSYEIAGGGLDGTAEGVAGESSSGPLLRWPITCSP